MENEITTVVFRVWEGGDVFALFPEIDDGRGYCSSYEQLGQHAPADYRGCIRDTSPATPEQYAALKRELEAIGYTLRVRNVPSCDGDRACDASVTHIDASGYAYCEPHGLQRRASGQRCRKLRPHELRRLERGQTIARY